MNNPLPGVATPIPAPITCKTGTDCPVCGEPLKKRQTYCSTKCRRIAYWTRKVDELIARFRADLIKEIVR